MDTISDSTGIRGSVESLIGGRKENQDSYGMADTRLGLFVVVCDGMGGGPAGKTASSIATQTLIDYVSGADRDKSPYSVLADAVKAANEAVLAAVNENPSLRGMGTTCVCLLIGTREAYIVHVGDSRCYQLRGSRAIFRTADHSYVGEMVRRGTLTEEEARNSNYSNIITRAIGGTQDVEPEVDSVEYKPGDRFALMTDGIWGAIPEAQLVKFLVEKKDPANLVPEIAYNIDSLGADNGGMHDNLTLALVEIPAGKAPLADVRHLHGDKADRIERRGVPQRAPEGRRPTIADKLRHQENRRVEAAYSERNRKPVPPKDVREKSREAEDYKNRDERREKRRKPLSPAVWICLIVIACAISVGVSMIFYHTSDEPASGNPAKGVVVGTGTPQAQNNNKKPSAPSNTSGKQSKQTGGKSKTAGGEKKSEVVPSQAKDNQNAKEQAAPKSQTSAPENEDFKKAIDKLDEMSDVHKPIEKKDRDKIIQDFYTYVRVGRDKISDAQKKEKANALVEDIKNNKGHLSITYEKNKTTKEALDYINKYKKQLQELMQQ